MERWGLAPDRTGALSPRDRRGAVAEEPSPLDAEDPPEPGFGALVQEGGWTVLDPGKGRGHGTTSHRGVLHPDEYVDRDALSALMAERFGFSLDQVAAVYRQGPLSAADRELRDRIDARLLEVAEDGGRMLEIARVFGWSIKEGGPKGGPSCDTLERALRRAREAS